MLSLINPIVHTVQYPLDSHHEKSLHSLAVILLPGSQSEPSGGVRKVQVAPWEEIHQPGGGGGQVRPLQGQLGQD